MPQERHGIGKGAASASTIHGHWASVYFPLPLQELTSYEMFSKRIIISLKTNFKNLLRHALFKYIQDGRHIAVLAFVTLFNFSGIHPC